MSAGARPTFLQRLTASAGLSALFVVVYGGCNWITAHRIGVPTINFAWERHIPFLPLFIAPYLSIDLFFIAAPFLCATHRELATLTKRIAAAIGIAGICFLLFPLRFAFARPRASGWLGAAFDRFRALDQPYNLVPCLHVALCLLLAEVYLRHARGTLRVALGIWFALIAASALFTWQHHVIDVIAGMFLAACCSYTFREQLPHVAPTTNRRIGVYYLAGAAGLLGVGVAFRPVSAVMAWSAAALGLVAQGYYRLGGSVFRKTDGAIPWSTAVLFLPSLAGQHISRLYYRRRSRLWDQITPNVWIGGVLNNREAAEAVNSGVTAVLDLTAEFSAPRAFRSVIYRNIPILDLTAPTARQLFDMAAWIAEHAQRGIVYVHCKIGYSRSAGAVAAYLMLNRLAADLDRALSVIRIARPGVIIRPEIIAALRQLEAAASFSSPPESAQQNIAAATL